MTDIKIPAGMRGLTLWQTDAGWQAGITFDRSSWRVAINKDPLVALAEVLAPAVKLDFLA